MTRVTTPKVGDIFKVFLPNGNIMYFQYVSPNKSDSMGGEAVRVLKLEHPPTETRALDNILSSGLLFFAITYIKSGLKTNYWEKIGNMPLEAGFVQPMFRITPELGSGIAKSLKWKVWKVPDVATLVGELPKEYLKLPMGGVNGPLALVRIMERGRDYDHWPT